MDKQNSNQENLERMYALGMSAESGGNFSEAYNYFKMILESDHSISRAWLGKGRCAGSLGTAEDDRLNEVMSCFTEAFKLNPSDEFNELNIFHFIQILHASQVVLFEHYEYLEKNAGGGGWGGVGFWGALGSSALNAVSEASASNARKNELSEEYLKYKMPTLLRGIDFCVEHSIAKEVKDGIIEIENLINQTNTLSYTAKQTTLEKIAQWHTRLGINNQNKILDDAPKPISTPTPSQIPAPAPTPLPAPVSVPKQVNNSPSEPSKSNKSVLIILGIVFLSCLGCCFLLYGIPILNQFFRNMK